MNGTIVLTLKGLREQHFVFTEPAVCTVGRSDDCDVQVPNLGWYGRVSRRHCQLDIDPPIAVVRDLGSRNGTFVNGRIIGRRGAEFTPDAPPPAGMPVELCDGDEIGIGDLVLQVSIDAAEREFADNDWDEAGVPLLAH